MEKWGHFAHENLSVLHFTKEENAETVFKSVKIFQNAKWELQTHNSHSLFTIYIIFDLEFHLIALCLNVYIYFVFLEQFISFLMFCFGFFVFGLVVRSFARSLVLYSDVDRRKKSSWSADIWCDVWPVHRTNQSSVTNWLKPKSQQQHRLFCAFHRQVKSFN